MGQDVLLGGLDVAHLSRDREMRARGLVGNSSAFVLELGARLDRAHLERRLVRAVDLVPELRFRLAGGFPMRPRWVVDTRAPAPRPAVRELGRRSLLEVATDLVNEPLDVAHPWALELCRGPEHDALVFRWLRSLADDDAAARLVRWLGSGEGDQPDAPAARDARFGTSEARPLDRRQRLAPVLSPQRARRLLGDKPSRKAQKTRALRVLFDVEQTRAFDARVRRVDDRAEIAILLLATTRAVDDLMLARGFAPALYVVPLSRSLDPKAECGRFFGNRLTTTKFVLDRDDLRDEARALARLSEQPSALGCQQVEPRTAVALELARFLPRFAYRILSTYSANNRASSFFFSSPGELGVFSFAGAPVRDAYVLPAAVSPPGLQLAFTRHGGCLSAVVTYLEDAVTVGEARRLAESLRAELLEPGEANGSAVVSV